jgi:organic hydroperoxide reductase OsmC/OhrA
MIAGAWTACFGTTLLHVARGHGVDTSEAVCRATVTLDADHEKGEYTISEAKLSVYAPGAEPDALEAALKETHTKCPVSKVLTSGVADLEVEPSASPLEAPPEPAAQPSG